MKFSTGHPRRYSQAINDETIALIVWRYSLNTDKCAAAAIHSVACIAKEC